MRLTPVVAIVQARVGSSRLRGKVLEEIGGWPMLQWTLERVRLARKVDGVVLAIPMQAENDPLIAIARHLGVDVYRGSESDVLHRFAEAAREFQAETVVRVCADSPLVAPEFIDAAVDCYEAECPDLAYNLGPLYGCQFPFGMGCEVFGKEMLFRMDQTTAEPSHREHVTAYLHDHRSDYRISMVPYQERWGRCDTGVDLSVDVSEDLELVRKLAVGLQFDASAEVIVERARRLARPGATAAAPAG